MLPSVEFYLADIFKVDARILIYDTGRIESYFGRQNIFTESQGSMYINMVNFSVLPLFCNAGSV